MWPQNAELLLLNPEPLQTLLDTLAGRRGTEGVRGEIRVNGALSSPSEIQAASGYVLQVRGQGPASRLRCVLHSPREIQVTSGYALPVQRQGPAWRDRGLPFGEEGPPAPAQGPPGHLREGGLAEMKGALLP